MACKNCVKIRREFVKLAQTTTDKARLAMWKHKRKSRPVGRIVT